MKKHKKKIKLARRLRTSREHAKGIPIFDTKAWRLRAQARQKNKVEKEIEKEIEIDIRPTQIKRVYILLAIATAIFIGYIIYIIILMIK